MGFCWNIWVWQGKEIDPPGKKPGPETLQHWYCLPKQGASDEALQRNLNYVCGLGLD